MSWRTPGQDPEAIFYPTGTSLLRPARPPYTQTLGPEPLMGVPDPASGFWDARFSASLLQSNVGHLGFVAAETDRPSGRHGPDCGRCGRRDGVPGTAKGGNLLDRGTPVATESPDT